MNNTECEHVWRFKTKMVNRNSWREFYKCNFCYSEITQQEYLDKYGEDLAKFELHNYNIYDVIIELRKKIDKLEEELAESKKQEKKIFARGHVKGFNGGRKQGHIDAIDKLVFGPECGEED